jgi:AcrR family transcriptional regulator
MAASAVDVSTIANDPRRYSDQLLKTARELFASVGEEVSMAEIARHSGVAIATMYRHFPTKDELIDAVLEDVFGEVDALAHAALMDPDPWHGLCEFLAGYLEIHARSWRLWYVVVGEDRRRRWEERVQQAWSLIGQIAQRAREQGTLRSDFALEDIALMAWSGDAVIEHTSGVAPDLWRRFLGLLLDGLRAERATPLSVPAATRAQVSLAGARYEP